MNLFPFGRREVRFRAQARTAAGNTGSGFWGETADSVGETIFFRLVDQDFEGVRFKA
jgi:hypothetical protein